MKPYDMMSSFRDAKILFQGQQNENRTEIKREHTEERHRRQITEAADPRRDQHRAQEPGPLGDTTSEGHSTL
jgi:hypothetical protein